MKKRVLYLVVCLVFSLGICTAAYAAKGGNPGGKNGNADPGAGKKPAVSEQGLQNAAESTGGEVVNEESGIEEEPSGEAVKTKEKVKVRKGPGVKVKGKEIKFDIPPVIKEGRTLIPVRAIMNGLGAGVAWDEAAKTVTVTKDNVTIVITLGSNVISVNGVEQTIDVPAQLISNRTFVPVRFIAQALKMNVGWDEDTETVEIGEGEDTTETGTDTTGETPDTEPGTGTEGTGTEGTGTEGTGTEGTTGTGSTDTTTGTGTTGTESTGTDSTGTGTTGTESTGTGTTGTSTEPAQ